MTELCQLARNVSTLEQFKKRVDAHGGDIARRWEQCRGAGSLIGEEKLYALVRCFEVHAFDVKPDTAQDWLGVQNQLATRFSPTSQRRTGALLNAIYKLVADRNPVAGVIDVASLRTEIGPLLPPLGAATRRERLARERDASRARIANRLISLNVQSELAEQITDHVYTTPASVQPLPGFNVMTGPIGVGKSTEIERLHLQAIDAAISDVQNPLPVYLRARDLPTGGLTSAVRTETEGLGDPTAVGVHVVIDGVDESSHTIDDMSQQAATLIGRWPNSTIIASSRPQEFSKGISSFQVEPMSVDTATKLIDDVSGSQSRSLQQRAEIDDLLRRPLFAIRHGLNLASRRTSRARQSDLINDIGQEAIADLDPGLFDLLVCLAAEILNADGRSVPVRQLNATPLQLHQLTRSRVTETTGERVNFQLAVLTEWFAGSGLLTDDKLLATSTETPVRAKQWRYALVQAITRADSLRTDYIMETLLRSAPGTAAWVLHEASPPLAAAPPSDNVPVVTQELASRFHGALRYWSEPWPDLVNLWRPNGLTPILGLATQGRQLISAWQPRRDPNEPDVVQLSPNTSPFDGSGGWRRMEFGGLANDVLGPWERTRSLLQTDLDRMLKEREFLRDVEPCWPELAWEYANRVVARNAHVRGDPVTKATLEEQIARARSHNSAGEVIVGRGQKQWRVLEAEHFVELMVAAELAEIQPPWPTADQQARWIWNWWSTDRLLERLRRSTKAALDTYAAVVRLHLPELAPELSTYQLLPARVRGVLTPAKSDGAYEDGPQYNWWLEPLPHGSENDARWSVGNATWGTDDSVWVERKRQLRELRGENAALIRLVSHGGAPHALDPTPAGNLALQLLVDDLRSLRWTTPTFRYDSSSPAVVPARLHSL